MLLLERLISLYAPHVCVGCGIEEDTLLCGSCQASTSFVPSRCYRCKAATRGYSVCGSCLPYTALRHVFVATHYDGVAKELLHRLKYERGRMGVSEVAELMSYLVDELSSEAVFVPIPTATSRVRHRGYDQAELIAQYMSRSAGLPVFSVLRRIGQAHQVGSGRKERLEHLNNAFRVVHRDKVKGAHCILVDDVLTTGATVETAAKILKKAGASQVDALIYSQPT